MSSEVNSGAEKIERLTCIICPVGCHLEVLRDGSGAILGVTGNSCPRGRAYAVTELTAPVRTLTATVALTGAAERRLPVKTSAPIPKNCMLQAMDVIHSMTVSAPVSCGDVIAHNFICEGVDLVACKDAAAKPDRTD